MAATLAGTSIAAQSPLPDDALGYEAVEARPRDRTDDFSAWGFDDRARIAGRWISYELLWVNAKTYQLVLPPGYSRAQLWGMSPSSGFIVGNATTVEPTETLADAYSLSHGPRILSAPWAFIVDALDANDWGAAVGYSSFPTAPILWRPGEDGINLGGLPGGTGRGRAYALNAFNEVVGESTDGDFEPQPFLWTESGGMIDLTVSHPDVIGGYATDINDLTEIVGKVRAYDEEQAFAWRNGTMMLLPRLPGGTGCAVNFPQFAHAINNQGVIVGAGVSNDCEDPAALVWWEVAPGRFRMANLTPPDSGVRGVPSDQQVHTAAMINNGNQIIGESSNTSGFDHHAYILTPFHHTMSDLTPGRAGERNRLSIGNLEPGTEVYLLWGSGEGAQTFDAVVGSGAGNPPIDCLGGPLLIQNVRGILGPYVPDLNGNVNLEFFIPPSASHRTARLQAVVPATCRVSHVVTVEIE